MKLDMTGWFAIEKEFEELAARIPGLTNVVLQEVSVLMTDRFNQTYNEEIGEGRSLPTRDTGKYGGSINVRYGHRSSGSAWVAIVPSVSYSDAIEHGSASMSGATAVARGGTRPVIDRIGGQRRLAEHRWEGPLADAIYAWDARKMHRGPRFADSVIKRLVNEGLVARRLLEAAFSTSTPGGAAFTQRAAEYTHTRMRELVVLLRK